jgi:SPP1 gp7 family putative phage head morphogenesis protein
MAEAVRRIIADYAPGGAYHQAWLERYTSLISTTVRVGGQQLAGEVGLSFSLENPRALQIVRQRAGALVSNVTETTRDAIRAAVEAGRTQGLGTNQIARLIEETTFGEISKSRAKVIARTEVVASLNAGAYEAARQSRVMQSKSWITQGDDRVRDSHAAINGQRVPMDGVFGNGLPFPHAPGAPAAESIQCRCTLGFHDEVAPL